jgi:hypothetical protein
MESGVSDLTQDSGGRQQRAPLNDESTNLGGKGSTSARIASELPKHATRAMASATAKGVGIPGPLQPLAAAAAARAARWAIGAARRYPVPAIIVGVVVIAALAYGRKRSGGQWNNSVPL